MKEPVIDERYRLTQAVRVHGKGRFNEEVTILRKVNNAGQNAYAVKFDDGVIAFLKREEIYVPEEPQQPMKIELIGDKHPKKCAAWMANVAIDMVLDDFETPLEHLFGSQWENLSENQVDQIEDEYHELRRRIKLLITSFKEEVI